MNRYITLLRGINVGGRNKLKMQALREALQTSPLENIRTYIQSGNILFGTQDTIPTQQLEQQIHQIIEKKFGYDLPILVMQKAYLEETIQHNPFVQRGVDEIKYLHVTFLAAAPEEEALETLRQRDSGTEEWQYDNQRLYLFYPDGYGRSKMNNNFFEKKLKVAATTRNWKTCLRLHKMAQED